MATGSSPDAPKESAKGMAQKRRAPNSILAGLKSFMLSPLFQCAAQLTVGMFIICLFTFVNKMRFLQSCLSATLYVVCSVLVSQDGHVGTKLLGCAMVCGSLLWGTTLAGCVLSFALVVGEPGTSGHSAFLCCLSAAVLAVLVVNRMGANPPFLWVLGMVSCLAFGLTTIVGQFVRDHGALWRDVVGHLQLAMAVGAGTAAVMGVVVLPTLAADEMRERVAEAVRGAGVTAARYASAAFKPEDPSQAFCRRPSYNGGGGGGGGKDGKDSKESKHSKGKPPQPAAASLLPPDADTAAGGAAGAADRDGDGDVSSQTYSSSGSGGDGDLEVEAAMEDNNDLNDDDYLQLLRELTAPLHHHHHRNRQPPPPQPSRKGTGGPEAAGAAATSEQTQGAEQANEKEQPAGGDSGGKPPPTPKPLLMPPLTAGVHGGLPVAALRPLLARARMCIGAASLEPPLFLAAPINPPAWGRVVGAAEELLTRVAALEGLVGEACTLQVMADASLTCYFEVDIVPYFRRVHAHVAATCATLADAIRHRARGGDQAARIRGCSAAFGRTWQQSKEELRDVTRQAFQGYWGRVRAAGGAGKLRMIEAHRMRGIAFMWTLTNSLIDAMEGLERAVAAAHGIAMPPPTPATVQQAPPAGHQQQNPAGEGGAVAVAVAAAPAAGGGSGGQAVAEGVEGGDEEAPKPAAAAAAAPSTPPGPPPPGLPPPPTWFQHNFGWAVQLTLVALGLPLVTSLVHTLGAELSALRRGAGWKALLRSRVFQAGAKYWACLVTVLLLILGLSEQDDTRDVAVYRPMFGYIAAVLAMSERVEATISKVTFWVVGTAIGGTLGYLAMLDTHLATNPYGLMVIICVYTFLVGCTSAHALRAGIVLTLMTLSSVILCQYRGCCDATGSVKVYAARVLSVMAGCSVPVLLSNLVLPWYTSDWALDVMGSSFLAACRLVRSYYASYYNDGLRAYTAVHGEAAAAAVCAAHGAPSQPLPTAPSAQAPASSPHAPATAAAPAGGPAGGPPAPPQPQARPKGVPAPAGPPPTPLQALVAGPLTSVQVSLMKDTTVWSRGFLATPRVVFAVLRGSQALLDRLAALALMASAAPALRGCFSGWAFEHIVVPLYGDTMYVFEAVDAMAAAAAAQLQLLAGGAASQAQVEAAAEAVAAAVEELHRRRLQIRNHVLRRRTVYHVGVMSAPEDLLPRMTNPDDAVRVFSFMFALIQVANKATALARTIGAHRRPSVGVLGRAYSAWCK
ncbi:hypothetical protein CHLRE_17g733400v5 [Chlamydomonas reinhardtii]|uniref:Uncharacterized protein n=1 Tax=Chlamydomonas reinhardtii TaxID=3055 RepID=A0A2K3CR59_CHLRE|nr:uncharacterized protein CHLRE_17g733400v5 [Chlamydomonas reinhardtii]PNW70765.1 hypothetical protein CHLRE_17g733400v5 [Chlamydomonas reinhardtii]